MTAADVSVTSAQRAERRGVTKVWSGRLWRFLPALATFGVFIAIWYLFASVLLSEERRFLVPTPDAVWQQAFADATNREELLSGLFNTIKVSATGLAIAMVLGVGIALLMSQAQWIERSLYPYAILLQVVPILAIVPLLGLMFGFNFQSRVIVCVILCLFPIITNTLFGLKSADRGLHDLFTLQRASRLTRFWKLQLPAALPATFTGFRIAAGLAVIGAIVGDFFFRQGDAGLGILLDRYRAQLRTEELYGAIFWCAVLGLAYFTLFGLLNRRITGRWHDPGRDAA